MHHDHRRMRALYAVAVAAALVFGGTQAVAAPEAVRERACTKIYPGWCNAGSAAACASYCAQNGFASSQCIDDPMRPRSCCSCGN
jgi:hypothetical protein